MTPLGFPVEPEVKTQVTVMEASMNSAVVQAAKDALQHKRSVILAKMASIEGHVAALADLVTEGLARIGKMVEGLARVVDETVKLKEVCGNDE